MREREARPVSVVHRPPLARRPSARQHCRRALRVACCRATALPSMETGIGTPADHRWRRLLLQ
eukprot:13127542-Alexandrium_andersonii.AAC.1